MDFFTFDVSYNSCMDCQRATMPPQNAALESGAGFRRTPHRDMAKRIKSETGFGPRLAALRKAAGFTQTAFAAEIGVSQRMMAYYEGASANPPSTLLPAMAATLGVSADALLGTETAKRRTKPTDTRMQRRLQQLEKLPPQEKRQVFQLLDAFIERAQLKQQAQS